MVVGTLPVGLSLDPVSGVLSGVPTRDGAVSNFVVAAFNGPTGVLSATTTISVGSPAADHLVVGPRRASIGAGGSQAFTGLLADASGNVQSVVTGQTTFTIAGGGTCSGAVCTSTQPGEHVVTGTYTAPGSDPGSDVFTATAVLSVAPDAFAVTATDALGAGSTPNAVATDPGRAPPPWPRAAPGAWPSSMTTVA